MARIQDTELQYNKLPQPDGGVIYLQDAIYDLKLQTITTSATIQFPEDGNCKLQNGVIVYTGNGTLFSTPEMGDNVKRISDITLLFTGNGTLFNLTGTNPLGALVMDNMLINGANSLGSLDGFLFTTSAVRMLNFGTGLTLTDMALTDLTRLQLLGTNQSTSFITWDGTTQGPILISQLAAQVNTNEHIFDFDSGVTYTGVAANDISVALSGSATKDNVFASGSNTQKTVGFKFTGCVRIPDSTVSSRIGFQDNSTETVIDQVLVPVRINGTYTDGFEERTSYTSSGDVTYLGLEDATINARAYVSLEPVSGVNILMGAYIAHTQAETYEITFTNGTNLVNRTAHGLSNGTSIRFSTGGILPAEIRDDQFYWVVNKTDNTFQVSRTDGGAVHTFTDDGTGTHYYSLGEYKETSEVTTSPSINQPLSIVVEDLLEVSTGDTLEVFVDNHDSTSNIIVTSINFIITKN